MTKKRFTYRDGRRIALLIDPPKVDTIWTAYTVRAMVMIPRDNLSVRNGVSEDMDDLTISAQAANGKAEWGVDGLYGWTYQFRNVWSADYQRVQSMMSFMRRIRSSLSKMAAVQGPPDTFPQFCQRIAIALHASSFLIKPVGCDSAMHSEIPYELVPVSQAPGRMEEFWKIGRFAPEPTADQLARQAILNA